MRLETDSSGPVNDRRAIPVLILGLLVAVGPVLAVPFPGGGGPITFAIRALQVATVLVGGGVAWAGYYSYRTGTLRPSIAPARPCWGGRSSASSAG